MSGWTTSLLEGLAVRLDGAGIADWDPAGAYPQASTGRVITLRSLPPAPDRAAALAMYPLGDGDDAGLADVLVAVQVRTRGTSDPREMDDFADAIFEELHGASMLTLGGVHVSLIRRQSGALLPPDESGRHQRTDNYYLNAARPNAYRLD